MIDKTPGPHSTTIVVPKPAVDPGSWLNDVGDWLGTHAATVGTVGAILIVTYMARKVWVHLPKEVLVFLAFVLAIMVGVVHISTKR